MIRLIIPSDASSFQSVLVYARATITNNSTIATARYAVRDLCLNYLENPA